MEGNVRATSHAKTVSQATYESLKEAILNGALAPGAKLNQDDLAGQLGVSRMPIREALGRLESEGLLVFETYRGARVAELSPLEAEQIYLMRLALEPQLARLGAEKLDAEAIATLENAYAGMTKALADGDASTLFEQVRSFHETLYAAADRPLVLSQVLGLRDLGQRYIRRYLTLPGRLAHSVENHRIVLDAARKGQPARVAELIGQELEATREALLVILKRAQSGAEPNP